jgi:GntR family transcriptional regulator/MocR family aminotransferase
LLTKGLYIVPEQRTATIKARSNRIGDIILQKQRISFHPSFHLSSTQRFSEAKYELNGQPDLRLHPIHEFSKWYGASMKRKSLISKWNQNKTSIPYLKTNCVII